MHLGIPLLLILLATAGVRPLSGQAYSCAADTTTDATNLRDYVVRLTGGDPSLDRTRRMYQLPLTSPSQVKIQTLPKTCKAAARAYHRCPRAVGAGDLPDGDSGQGRHFALCGFGSGGASGRIHDHRRLQ
jgi:hypothetical protein